MPIEKMVEFHESGDIPEGLPRFVLPVNILGAATAELLRGFSNNAKADWIMAMRPPQKIMDEKPASAITTTWSQDKKGFNFKLPLPQEWRDLYQSWNMAFIYTFRDFPYAFTEFLKPAVSGYQSQPREYRDNRTCLFVHIYYLGFYRSGKIERGEKVMN